MESNKEKFEEGTRKRVELSPLRSFVINHISHGAIGNAVNQLEGKDQVCNLKESRHKHTFFEHDSN